jgi:tripeptide aminopeptidase
VPTIQQERLLKLFLDLVKTDSATREEGAVAAICQAQLERLGFTVQYDKAGEAIGGQVGNLIATRKGEAGSKALLLSAHMDRVVPGKGIKPIIEDGIIRSDGTTILAADDCVGLAAIIEGVEAAQEAGIPLPTIEIVFCIAEEGGLMGSKHLDTSLLTATEGYILDADGPVGQITVKAPAQTKFTYRIIGRAAHGGVEPEKGINALYVAAEAITGMKLGRIDEETTANIGLVQGGTATNAVMEVCELKGDARSLGVEKMEAQVAHMTERLEAACAKWGARLEAEITRSYGPVKLDWGAESVERSAAAIRRLGLDPQLVASGGGSDANNFNTQGIESVCLSVNYKAIHSVKEHMAVADLVKSAELVVALIEEYASR